MKRFKFLGLLFALPLLTGCVNSYSIGIYADADKYLVGNQTYEGSVTAVDVQWACGDVTLVSDDTINGASIVEENQLSDADKVHTYFNEGKLMVKFFASGHRTTFLNPHDKDVTITYNPKDITEFVVSLTSGKVISSSVIKASEKVDIKLTSGETTIGGIDTGTATLNVTSGKLTVNSLKATTANVKATSGTSIIKEIEANSFISDLTSGINNYEFKSFGDADIHMTSGSAYVKLPENGGVVTISKTSGTINANREHTTNNNVYTFGTSESAMRINFTSGTLTIE